MNNLIFRALRHLKHLRKLVTASEIPLCLDILKYMGPFLLKLLKVPLRTDNFLDPLLTIATMANADIVKVSVSYFLIS